MTARTFRLPRQFRDEMVAHAREGFPYEVCGVVLGPAGEPRELRRVSNAAPDPLVTYDMEPHELLRLNQRADDNGWEFVIIYHSHPPFAEAYPSATDIAKAFYPDAVYVILAIGRIEAHERDRLRDPARRADVIPQLGDPWTMTPRVRAFRIVKREPWDKSGQVEELAVEIA